MQININENWRISTDTHNFIIEQKSIVEKGKSKGEVKWKQMGFYPKMHQAVEGYSRRFMLNGDETTVEELKASLAVLSKEIAAIKIKAGE